MTHANAASPSGSSVLVKLTPSELIPFLTRAIQMREPVCVVSSPGCGKSSITNQVAAQIDRRFIISNPSVEDPTDSKGIPASGPDGTVDFQPVGQIKKVLAATEPTVWLLEDFGQAIPAVQAPYMQWLLARECAGHKLPDCVTMIILTNRRQDRTGVVGMLTAINSRVTFVELVPDVNDWSNWMLDQTEIDGVPLPQEVLAEQVAFVRSRPDLFSKFDAKVDMANCPTPRNWTFATKWMTNGLPRKLMLAGLTGRVGAGAAHERMAFHDLITLLPSLDAIIADPKGADIPTETSALFAIATGLAARCTVQNAERIVQYAERLIDSERGQFAALIYRDSIRRKKDVIQTPAFVRFVTLPGMQNLMGASVS